MNRDVFVNYNRTIHTSFFKKITLKYIFDNLSNIRHIDDKRYIKFNNIEFIFLDDDHDHSKLPINAFDISCTDLIKNTCLVVDMLDVFLESYVFDKHGRVSQAFDVDKKKSGSLKQINDDELIIPDTSGIARLHIYNEYSYINPDTFSSNLTSTYDNIMLQKPDNLRLHLIEFREPVLTNLNFDSIVYNFYLKYIKSGVYADLQFSVYSIQEIKIKIDKLIDTLKSMEKTIVESNLIKRLIEVNEIKSSNIVVDKLYVYFFVKLNNAFTVYFKNRIIENNGVYENILTAYTDNKYVEVNMSSKNYTLMKDFLSSNVYSTCIIPIEQLLMIEQHLKKYLDSNIDIKITYNTDYNLLDLYTISSELSQTNYDILISNLLQILRFDIGICATNRFIIAIDDYLTMLRMFRIFRNKDGDCEFVKKIIMIGGNYHTNDIYNCIKYLTILSNS